MDPHRVELRTREYSVDFPPSGKLGRIVVLFASAGRHSSGHALTPLVSTEVVPVSRPSEALMSAFDPKRTLGHS